MNSNLFYTAYDQIDTVQNSNSDCNFLKLPGISGFNQLGIPVLLNDSPRVHNGKNHKANPCYLVKGSFSSSDVQTCPICGQAMHVNDRLSIYLRHLPFGSVSTLLEVNSLQYICPHCNCVCKDCLHFKFPKHMIIKDNELLLGLDFVISSLSDAYNCKTEDEMKGQIKIIIDFCEATNNKHFKWFARLLKNHLDGICNYASYQITTSKVEGTNNMIKTLRRRHYGIPDYDYLFLKIMDESRS